ncbi:MAG TPA: ABC transporter ATP-binding protein [Burkholderiaceae bacterium]|nr:ABC transporter ATP-binding protein [Burkholderiaceae bacterium]
MFPILSWIGPFSDSAPSWFAKYSSSEALTILGALYLTGLALRTWAIFVTAKLNMSEGYAFGTQLFKTIIEQPYEWHFKNHSANIRAVILNDAQDIISFVMIPLGRLISQITLVIAVSLVLLFYFPFPTLFVGATVIVLYGLILIVLKKPIKRDAERQIHAHTSRHRLSTEAFASIREVRLSHLENKFVEEFAASSNQLALSSTNRYVYVELPKLVLEALIFIIFALMMFGRSASSALVEITSFPALALFAIASLKLFPMGHLVFVNLAHLRSGWPLVTQLENFFKNLQHEEASLKCPPLKKCISLKNISYRYPDSTHTVLKDMSFDVYVGQKIAITGPSGVGKSTLIDLIAGLLHPSNGTIEIDAMPLSPGHGRDWQKQLKYCPQSPCLFDMSIEENVTLGSEYSRKELDDVLKLTCLTDLVAQQPEQANRTAGEMGRNLSGGQIKRISIARAMLHPAAVYIFDEPTSNLDSALASSIMDNVFTAQPNSIFLIVTHDNNLVIKCDKVLELAPNSL